MPGFLAGELWKAENRGYHLYLKTATNLGVPPSLLMERGKTEPTWTERDKKLVLAWQQLQDELCPKCGVPRWLGHSEHPDIDFKTDTAVCYSCQFLEDANEKDKKGLPKGATRFVQPIPVEIEGMETKLPNRAEGYKAGPKQRKSK